MVSVLPVSPDELNVIGAFMAGVIEVSVDASAEEKARFIENTRKNLRKFSDAPTESVHLKCVSGGDLLGVVRIQWDPSPRLQRSEQLVDQSNVLLQLRSSRRHSDEPADYAPAPNAMFGAFDGNTLISTAGVYHDVQHMSRGRSA